MNSINLNLGWVHFKSSPKDMKKKNKSSASYLIIRLRHLSPHPFRNATEQFGLSGHAFDIPFVMPAMKDVGGETVKPASCFELSLPLSFFCLPFNALLLSCVLR